MKKNFLSNQLRLQHDLSRQRRLLLQVQQRLLRLRKRSLWQLRESHLQRMREVARVLRMYLPHLQDHLSRRRQGLWRRQ